MIKTLHEKKGKKEDAFAPTTYQARDHVQAYMGVAVGSVTVYRYSEELPKKSNNGLYLYLMINRLLEHDRSVLKYYDQKDCTVYSRFPIFVFYMEQGDDRE